MFTYHTAILRWAVRLSHSQLVVLDRHWVSEEIYARVYRGGTPWPLSGRMMDRVIKKHAGIYVLALPETLEDVTDYHYATKQVRLEMYDDITQVAKRYFDLWYGAATTEYNDADYTSQMTRRGGVMDMQDWHRYNIQSDGINMDAYIDKLLVYLRAYREAQPKLFLSPTYWNALGYVPTATTVVCGDKLNPKGKPGVYWPFYEFGWSSKFLNDHVHTAMIDEHRVVWTNVNDDLRALWEIIQANPNIHVVALGGEARRMLMTKVQDRRIWLVDHPSFVRRFDSTRPYSFDLRRAIL